MLRHAIAAAAVAAAGLCAVIDHHGWDLGGANGIDDDGVIVGNGFLGLRQHAWMLVPVSGGH